MRNWNGGGGSYFLAMLMQILFKNGCNILSLSYVHSDCLLFFFLQQTSAVLIYVSTSR
jgi:hypothetical protein